MATLTISEVIERAKVSLYLSGNSIARGALFGAKLNPNLQRMIYTEYKSLAWAYAQNSSYDNIQQVANYVQWLCGRFGLVAGVIINSDNGGSSVTPSTPTGSSIFPIYITSSDFADATNYNNSNIVGQNLIIFLNEINRYLIPAVDFEYTATGVNILVAGFDADTNEYNLVIEKVT